MKKAISLLLLLAMCLSMAACGADQKYAPLLDALNAGDYEGVKRELAVLSPEFREEQVRLAAGEASQDSQGGASDGPEGPPPEEPQDGAPGRLAPVSADCGWNERRLTDEEIEALLDAEPETMREKISTVADARALLDRRFPELMVNSMASAPGSNLYSFSHPAELLSFPDFFAGRTDIVNTVMWLVGDDLPVGMILAVVLVDESDILSPAPAINYLCTDTGYIFFDPILGMQGDEMSHMGKLNTLPEAKTDSLDAYLDMAAKDGTRLWKAYCLEESSGMEFILEDMPRQMDLLMPDLAPVYQNHWFDSAEVYASPEQDALRAVEKLGE